jgi:hypothetical protein
MNDDEIIYLYLKLKEWENSELTQRKFCAKNNINYIRFNNFKYTIRMTKKLTSDFIKKMEPALSNHKNGLSLNKCAKKWKVNRTDLANYIRHTYYHQLINEYENKSKVDRDGVSMNFIQVSNKEIAHQETHEPEQQIIKEQNDLEIIISKGIKVKVSPNIEPIKIIKIIELLRDI